MVSVVFEFEGDHFSGIVFDAKFRERWTTGISTEVSDSACEILPLSRGMDKEAALVNFFEVVKKALHDARIGKWFEVWVRGV